MYTWKSVPSVIFYDDIFQRTGVSARYPHALPKARSLTAFSFAMLSRLAIRTNNLFPASRQLRTIQFIRKSSVNIPSIACMVQLEAEKMAVVRNLPESTTMSIQVQIAGRLRNLERSKDELLEKSLMRLQKSAVEKAKGRKKKKDDGSKAGDALESALPPISIFGGPNESFPEINSHTTVNEMAWKQDYMLKIGETTYSIVVNPPQIEKLLVHGRVFSGIPIVPHVETIDTDKLEWQWFRYCSQNNIWEPISGGTERCFIPTAEDIGSILQVRCTPVQSRMNTFSNVEYQLKGFDQILDIGTVVVAPPNASSSRIDSQHCWTQHPVFRVMTYNILADQYASTDAAKESIFVYCDNKWLDWQHRRPLVFKEILDYKPDIACLQEVDMSAFSSLLRPGLQEFNFDGVYTNKAGRVNEGSATFWRKDRFKMISMEEMEMRKYFPRNSSTEEINKAPLGPKLRPMFRSSPKLCEALQKVGTVAQLILLAPCGPPSSWGVARPILVVNTHLFFHYGAPHIRTIHVWAMLQKANELIHNALAEKGEDLGGRKPCLVFCGDLNSDINDGIPGAIKLLNSGKVEANYWDWKFGANFSWGDSARGEEDDVPESTNGESENDPGMVAKCGVTCTAGMDLESPFALNTADDMIPDFTNYVQGYQGLLDYIWYQNNCIQVKNVAPIPGKDELGGYLPSYRYPSDHLAVVADLEFMEESQVKRDEKDVIHDEGVVLEASYRNVPFAETALQKERIIAVPTDTIYGIAGLASSSKAIEKIYAVKRRDASKPLAVCVADHGDISEICHTDHLPEELLKYLLPGPVTIVLERKNTSPLLSDDLNPGVDALAVRIPDFPFLRALCRQIQTPLVLTSANISGDQSPLRTAEMGDVASQCALIFDHGVLGEKRAGSTIVDLRKRGTFSIIREGSALQKTVSTLTQSGLMQNVS